MFAALEWLYSSVIARAASYKVTYILRIYKRWDVYMYFLVFRVFFCRLVGKFYYEVGLVCVDRELLYGGNG